MEHEANWTLSGLISAAQMRTTGAAIEARPVPVRAVAIDSRCVVPGACFVAMPGTNVDGHDYVDDAVRSGATSVVVERDVAVPDDVVKVRVPDAAAAAARLAATFYGIGQVQRGRRLRLIGVTGTNGKSTTARLIQSILHANGHRAALLGTIRYDLVDMQVPATLTTPGPIELCQHLAHASEAGASYAVMELSSHALAQRRADGLSFDVGVFTNLSGDHLDYHQSTEEYVSAKKRLFDGLADDARAVVNAEDPVSDDMVADCGASIVTYGIDGRALAVRGVLSETSWLGSTFDVQTESMALEGVRTGLVGRHNVMNALAAAGAATCLGLPPDAIRHGIKAATVVEGRLERVSPDDCPFAVLVDYAHTDHALENALRAIKPLTNGRLICVFGCGGDRDRTKRPRMGRAVARYSDAAFVTSDNPRSEDPMAIITEILPGLSERPNCVVEIEPDRERAIRAAIAAARPGDTVLLAGKGHENYQIIGDRRLRFDDAEVARQCLANLEVPA